MTAFRRTLTLLASLCLIVPLTGCDTLFGPDNLPASIVIGTSRQTIDLVGDTLHLTAEVRDVDGDVLENATVGWTSRVPSRASIDASGTFTALANGDVWIVARSGSVSDSVLFTIDSPIQCAPIGNLLVPDSVDSELSATDCEIEGRYHDAWRVELSAPGAITIDLTSTGFDTYLLLLNANGQIIDANDDGGAGRNSRLYAELPAGTYYPFVTSFAAGATGSYRLSAIEGAHPTPCPATATLSYPDTVAGTTTTDGSCDYNGFYVDVWRIDLVDSTLVTMQARGDSIPMQVAVADTFGRFLVGGGPPNYSWLETSLPPGSYDIWVGGVTQGVTGRYTLNVSRGPSTRYCSTDGALALGEPVSGELVDDDCYVEALPSDGWELTLGNTLDVELSVVGDPIYPQVLVVDSAGQFVDHASGSESSLRYGLTLSPGSYRFWVRSGTDDTGAYTLTVVEEGQLPSCDAVTPAVPDSTYEGALATTDCRLPDGRYADVWELHVDTTTTTTVGVASDKLDAYLIVADTLGRTIAEDDDSGSGTDAALTLDLDPGTYHLWTTSYASGELGGYALAIATGTGATTALEPLGSKSGSEDRYPYRRKDTGTPGWFEPPGNDHKTGGPGPR